VTPVELQEPAAEQQERLGRQPLSHACQVRQDLEQAVEVGVRNGPPCEVGSIQGPLRPVKSLSTARYVSGERNGSPAPTRSSITCQTSLSSWFSFQMPYAVPSSTGGTATSPIAPLTAASIHSWPPRPMLS
jgi:hypothetical protein